MSLRTRIERLEREVGAVDDRCPMCRDRPAGGFRLLCQDSPDATPRLLETRGDLGGPCPDCGWAPEVMQLTEVIVRSREDVARLEELRAERRQGSRSGGSARAATCSPTLAHVAKEAEG